MFTKRVNGGIVMTQFEIIVLSIIYLLCYGFTIAMFIKENNAWLRLFFVVISLALAFYAPLMIGGMLFKKLKDK
mgnify:CR=1 FL=1